MVYKEMIVHLSHTNKDADVNAGYSLVELLQEIDEREAKAKEWWLLMVYRNYDSDNKDT